MIRQSTFAGRFIKPHPWVYELRTVFRRNSRLSSAQCVTLPRSM